jgi:hypothetical protein
MVLASSPPVFWPSSALPCRGVSSHLITEDLGNASRQGDTTVRRSCGQHWPLEQYLRGCVVRMLLFVPKT